MEEMHTLGTGFTIRNFPTFPIADGEEPEGYFLNITPEAEDKVNKIIISVKSSRGEIISASVDIENLLGKSISRFFLKDNPDKREIFHELFLDTTELSFAQKKNILQLLMEKHPTEFGVYSEKKSRHDFFERINSIIKARNAFAHGEVIIDYNENKVMLQYYDKNKRKKQEIILSPEYFEQIKHTIGGLIWAFYSGISNETIITHIGEDEMP